MVNKHYKTSFKTRVFVAKRSGGRKYASFEGLEINY